MESSSWHSYPKVYALGHAAVADIWKGGQVVLQEKVDGSQFSFGVFNGELKCRSKGKQQDPAAPDSLFDEAIKTVIGLKGELVDGWAYRGEYLRVPKHNALCYDRSPVGNIVLFDINTGQEAYLPPGRVAIEAQRLGLEVVPTFEVRTDIPTMDELDGWLERDSLLGGPLVEGVVIKNYAQFGADKKVLMAKFVAAAYKEEHAKHWGKPKESQKEIGARIIGVYCNENRWGKAVQHLRDEGRIEGSPKDISDLIKEVRRDVFDECEAEIKRMLFDQYKGQIGSGIIRGLPEWYKRKLAESAVQINPEP